MASTARTFSAIAPSPAASPRAMPGEREFSHPEISRKFIAHDNLRHFFGDFWLNYSQKLWLNQVDVVQPGFFAETPCRAGVVMAGNVLWDMWGKCSTPAVPMSWPWFSRNDEIGRTKEQHRASKS